MTGWRATSENEFGSTCCALVCGLTRKLILPRRNNPGGHHRQKGNAQDDDIGIRQFPSGPGCCVIHSRSRARRWLHPGFVASALVIRPRPLYWPHLRTRWLARNPPIE